MTNGKTTPVAEKTADPVVSTPVAENKPGDSVVATPVVETKESTTPVATPDTVKPVETVVSDTPALSAKIIGKLANEIKNAESDTNAVTLGGRSLASKDQSNRKGTHRGNEVIVIRKFTPGESDIYKLGDNDPDGKVIEKGNSLIGELNPAGVKNKAIIELLIKEYENPKESYDNKSIQNRVHSGILAMAGNLILKSYKDSGIADMVFGLHLVRRIAKWDLAEREALYTELRSVTIKDDTLAKIDRESVETFATLRYDLLNKLHGFTPVVKASAKSNETPTVSLDDIDSIDLSSQVPVKAESSATTKSTGKGKGQSNPTPTHKEFDPASITAAAKEGKPATIQATPPVISSVGEHNGVAVNNTPATPPVTVVEPVKSESPAVESPKSDPVVATPESSKPAVEETKPAEKTDSK